MSEESPILIVEDEPKLAALLQDYLVAAGYPTLCLDNGLQVVPTVRAQPPRLILLDLMLPGRDGMQVCQDLRGFSAVPIIMITARVEEVDRLLGLDLGADDYICKPFSPPRGGCQGQGHPAPWPPTAEQYPSATADRRNAVPRITRRRRFRPDAFGAATAEHFCTFRRPGIFPRPTARQALLRPPRGHRPHGGQSYPQPAAQAGAGVSRGNAHRVLVWGGLSVSIVRRLKTRWAPVAEQNDMSLLSGPR